MRVLILCASLFGLVALSTSCAADSRSDARAILQLLLNAPQLTRYYHFDTRPERVPLKIVNRTPLDLGDPDLTAAGQKARLATGRDDRAIEITTFTIAAETAEIAFTFRAEGVVGKGTFKKVQGNWSVSQLSVAER
jgi:hypothetical protein